MFSKHTADSSPFSKDRADFSQRNELEWMRHKLIPMLKLWRTAHNTPISERRLKDHHYKNEQH